MSADGSADGDFPPFTEDQLLSREDPLVQLKAWLDEDPDTSMSLATVAASGKPSCRLLGYGGVYDGGIRFYTDSSSRKAQEFSANPNVALTFFSLKYCRQIRVEGTVRELPKEIATAFIKNLSRERQLVLQIGQQDKPIIGGRAELEEKKKEMTLKYSNTAVLPTLPFWSAYCVMPSCVEFYQGHVDWLADRLVFTRQSDDSWSLQRLLS